MSLLTSLSLKVRKRLPAPVRLLLRVGRHLSGGGGGPSPLVPSHLLTECRVCASREELLRHMPKGAMVAEVGVEHGIFSRRILDETSPAALHLVDLDFGALDPSLPRDPRVTMHTGFSHEVLAAFPNAHFDWIYIDADHSYAGVRRDAQVASAKVKPGGYLVFNDFAHMDPYLGAYGVHRAVVEFAVERDWPFAWWAYQPNALYDVALRRPA